MRTGRTAGSTRRGLLLTALLACLTGSGTYADDWLQYNGNSGNRTSAEHIGAIAWSQASPPAPYWETPTTNGFSSFSVADGKAFTLVSRVYTDSVLRECCVAYNAATGAELWASPMVKAEPYDSGGETAGGGDGPRSTPTCDGERVYALDRDLNLYCFSAETGAAIWSKNIVSDYGGRLINWQNAASPLLEGEMVILAGGGSGQSFLAFNRATGALVWKTNVNERMTHASPVAATIHGVRQIIFYVQSGLVAVDSSSGEELWRYAIAYSTSTGASPVVFGNYVYHSAGYGVGAGVCQVVEKGADFQALQVWRKRGELQNHWSTPVCHNGYIYGLYGYRAYTTAELKCVNLLTGAEMWSKPDFGQGNLILVGDKLVVLGAAGDIAVVEATHTAYTEIARADMLDGKCWSTPVLSDNRIYARSTVEGICFELSSMVTSLTAPSNPRAAAIAEDSITCAWQDNSDSETAFAVYFGIGPVAPSSVTATTAANATQWIATSLQPNTQYAFQVSSADSTSQSAKTENCTIWTLAATPTVPLVDSPATGTLEVTVGEGDRNPEGTVYAIWCVTAGQWLQPGGTLDSNALWQTRESWGTATCADLSPNTTYEFQVKARNGAGVETLLGLLGSAQPQPTANDRKTTVSPSWLLYR